MKSLSPEVCSRNCWFIGAGVGLIGFLLNWLVGDNGFIFALLLGVVLAFLVGFALIKLICDTSAAERGVAARSSSAMAANPPAAEPIASDLEGSGKDQVYEPAEVIAPEEQPVEIVSQVETVVVAEVDGVVDTPTRLKEPRATGADDLKKIKGIGPKLEEMLNSLGYYHFDQLAGWSAVEIAWVDENLTGFKGRASRDAWVEQARFLSSDHSNDGHDTNA